MHAKQLNERSPVRVLERSIHGGLGLGNLGVVVARHGVGKTAFLVGVALDDLMHARDVLHVSLDHSVDKVRTYYDEIFAELCRSEALDDVWAVRVEVERHRRIYSYLGGTFSVAKLAQTVRFLGEHGEFAPRAIMIDGIDFAAITLDDLAGLREIARSVEAEMWLSATTTREAQRNERGVPEPIAHLEAGIDVILTMGHDGRAVHVGLHKDHGNPQVSDLRLALDPVTLLLVRE
jgi:hypothetical protein